MMCAQIDGQKNNRYCYDVCAYCRAWRHMSHHLLSRQRNVKKVYSNKVLLSTTLFYVWIQSIISTVHPCVFHQLGCFNVLLCRYALLKSDWNLMKVLKTWKVVSFIITHEMTRGYKKSNCVCSRRLNIY